MLLPAADGQEKLAAVQDAAASFAGLLSLSVNDRVAVVGFNGSSWLEIGLTSSLGDIADAVDQLRIRVSEGTRLDLGLEAGLAALSGQGSGEGRQRVLVLLTDGLPNGVPTPQAGGTQEDRVVGVGAGIKGAGISVFTIGVGDADAAQLAGRVNKVLLTALATRASYYFETPNAGDLMSIYGQIAKAITCR
jgi:Mg-chelatase subunit ChlD